MNEKDKLRQAAEEIAREKALHSEGELDLLSSEEVRRVLHELRVHQIELVMQNEELRRAQLELDASRARYFDLYDLAPVGYVTLSETGLILEANLTAANLLGMVRGELVQKPITQFILKEDQDLYYRLRQQLFATGEPQRCDLRLVKKEGAPFWARMDATAAKESNGAMVCRAAMSDITAGKLQEEEHELIARLILLVNTPGNFREVMSALTGSLQNASECEAVGIRLRAGDDYPYYETSGFPPTFVQEENYLCSHGPDGKVLCDGVGNPVLECMCGNILQGRFDPSKPFFTSHGSFWTNSTSALLASTSEADRQARTRNRCNGEGYESVALIPLRADHQVFGLVQFNDHRANRFTPPLIAHFERMADSLSIALSRRQAEQALQESEKSLRMAQQLSRIGSWKWNQETNAVQWSKELCRINGHNPDLPAPSFEEMSSFYSPNDWKRLNKAVRKALNDGESYELELDLIRTDGVVIKTIARGEADYDAGGRMGGLHGTVQDITEQKRAEEEKARLEAQNQQLLKTESLHRMAGAIAHQFNNLLGAIIGNLELVETEMTSDSNCQEYLADAMKASRRASELSGRMLAYLGQTVGRHEMLNLSETCRAYLPPLRSFLPKNIGLEPDLQLPGPIICANSAQILQILSNLITNAWEAIGSDVGTIHLAIQTVPSEAISASQRFPPDWTAEQAAYACLEVRDTGCGIPTENIEKLFDPFFTTKFVGRGLGLPVVLGLVRAHEGGITVESRPDHGSIFRVYFPLSAEERPQAGEKASNPDIFS